VTTPIHEAGAPTCDDGTTATTQGDEPGQNGDLSTSAGADANVSRLRRGRTFRRAVAAALWLFVGLAALGVFGVRSATNATTARGMHVEVRYPATSRPGEPANWTLTVRRAGGFRGDVVVSTNDHYLSIFDQNDLSPQPTQTNIAAGEVRWTFDPPPGVEFTVALDGNIDTNVTPGRHDATTRVVLGDGETARTAYSTWTAP
jgi:hypothetical protein